LLGAPEPYSVEEAADRIAALPLLFEPGTQWNYSMSVDVLGRVLEVVAGQPLDEILRERIFEPLGMGDTGFQYAESERERLCALSALDPATGQAVLAEEQNLVGTERPQFFAGGHGLVSTASDYHRFTQMLLRDGALDGARILSPRTIDLMTENFVP